MYLNLIQIAESFGVSESVVEGWIRNEALPHLIDRDRLIFDRAQVTQWAAARGLAAQAGFLAPETTVFATGCRLEPLLRSGGIWRGLRVPDVPATLDKIVASLPAVTPPIVEMLTRRLRAKDGITWAPIGHGFALPHPGARIALGRASGTLALLLLVEPMPLPGPPTDEVPVTRMFFFVAPSPRAHLDLLARLGRALSDPGFRDLLIRGADDGAIFGAISATERSTAGTARPEARP